MRDGGPGNKERGPGNEERGGLRTRLVHGLSHNSTTLHCLKWQSDFDRFDKKFESIRSSSVL